MKFSVIVAFHNARATLHEALDSLHSQTFRDFELILVDDASTDGSLETVTSHALPFRSLRMEQNSGPGVARNQGAAVALGEFLTFLDADDRWFPWTLAVMQEAIQKHPTGSFLAGVEIRCGTPCVPNHGSPGPLVSKLHPDYFSSFMETIWIGVGAVAIRKDAFQRSGGFGQWHGCAEDSHLWLCLGTEPGFAHIESPALFCYRTSDASLSRHPAGRGDGWFHLLREEKHGNYPGGRKRRIERWHLISRHTRAGSLTLLDRGFLLQAMRLYAGSFAMNLRLCRFKYLAGFWGKLLWQLAR